MVNFKTRIIDKRKGYGILKKTKVDCPDISGCTDKILFNGIHCTFASKIDNIPYCILKGIRRLYNRDDDRP